MRDRSSDVRMFENTMDILKQGWYEKSSKNISLKLSENEMKDIQVYLPEDVAAICNNTEFKPSVSNGEHCIYSCENIDSYAFARKRVSEGISKVLVLNLASSVHPGGGVRRGARAQEEDLCRKSSLLLSLESTAAGRYYEYNRSLNSLMGSDALMLTPKVEIIKDENGILLDDTVVVSVLTCAAPKISNGKEGMSEETYSNMLYNRIAGMLKSAAFFCYSNLILGAWGCGAYGNDADIVSDLFLKALKELDSNGFGENDLFSRIDFAVLDHSETQYNFKMFNRYF